MNYLYAAYAVTWIIHVIYLASLVVRYQSLKQEMSESSEVKTAAGRRQ